MRGFSLIETIVYIALLGFIMSGAVITAYQVTQSSFVVSEKDTVQEEGNFVLRKLEHAFVGAQDLYVSGSLLSVDPYTGSNIVFTLSGGALFVNRGSGAKALTTDNVTVNSLVFTGHAGPPKGVTVQFTLDGEVFTLTKYVR